MHIHFHINVSIMMGIKEQIPKLLFCSCSRASLAAEAAICKLHLIVECLEATVLKGLQEGCGNAGIVLFEGLVDNHIIELSLILD